MPCIIALGTTLDEYDFGGTFFYLGYNPTAVDSSCDFSGIVDDDADGNLTPDDVTAYITDPAQGSAFFGYNGPEPGHVIGGVGAQFPDNTNPSFGVENWTPGFYGFAYLVGNLDGCFDIVCTEFEVIAGVDDMTPSAGLTYCTSDLQQIVDLSGEVTGYISGGTWTQTGGTDNISITDNDGDSDIDDATFPEDTTPDLYTFDYVIGPGDLTSTHPVEDCEDCNATVQVTVNITDTPEAGEANPVAVCN